MILPASQTKTKIRLTISSSKIIEQSEDIKSSFSDHWKTSNKQDKTKNTSENGLSWSDCLKSQFQCHERSRKVNYTISLCNDLYKRIWFCANSHFSLAIMFTSGNKCSRGGTGRCLILIEKWMSHHYDVMMTSLLTAGKASAQQVMIV